MALLNENTFGERGRFIVTMLNGVAVSTSSDWQWVGGYQPVTLSIEGDFVGSSQVYASLKPGNRDTARPTMVDIAYPTLLPGAVQGPQMLQIPNTVQWVKAVVTFADDFNPLGTCFAY